MKRVSDRQAGCDSALRAKYQTEKPSLQKLVESGRYGEPIAQGDYLQLMQVFEKLRELRQKRGLSLAQVFERSGIDRAALSRLENGQVANPTVATLENYARALGARVRFVVDEVDESTVG